MRTGDFSNIRTDFRQTPVLIRIILGILLVSLIGGFFYYWVERNRFEVAQAESALLVATLNQKVQELDVMIVQMTEENDELRDDLRREKRRNEDFEDQIDEIAGTVSVLDKLRKTDPELLIKYSKVSFLNEHYLPEELTPIDKEFVHSATEQRIHVRVDSFLEDLLEDAKEAGNPVRVVSAYRSFGTQAGLKSNYSVTYGSGANAFSADQGYSEHQLGTTVDFTTPELNGALDGFDTTTAYAWLRKNAHRYGFVLSYPPGNAYYQFEPWHWRFVGVDLAKDLNRAGKYFYDMDQREIDAYLVNIFD